MGYKLKERAVDGSFPARMVSQKGKVELRSFVPLSESVCRCHYNGNAVAIIYFRSFEEGFTREGSFVLDLDRSKRIRGGRRREPSREVLHEIEGQLPEIRKFILESCYEMSLLAEAAD